MDDVFYGYGTALAYWRTRQMDLASRRPPVRTDADLASRYAAAHAVRTGRFAGEDVLACLAPARFPEPEPPAHIVVPQVGVRSQSKLLACHVWRPPLPPDAFASLDPATHIASPPLCFVQMAALLDVGRLALLGLELCGGYALDPCDPKGFRRRDPLARREELLAATERCRGVRGVKRARRALAFVADGSASPMESAVVALLCAPRAIGGYGLPLPLLNHRIDLSGDSGAMSGSAFFSCDLFWPDGGVAVEYDSDMFHTGSERIARDSERRNALSYLGISVVTVTRRQVMSAVGCDRIAHLLEKHLGIAGRAERASSPERLRSEEARRASFRREVLGAPQT